MPKPIDAFEVYNLHDFKLGGSIIRHFNLSHSGWEHRVQTTRGAVSLAVIIMSSVTPTYPGSVVFREIS